jgi:hypothetical protein
MCAPSGGQLTLHQSYRMFPTRYAMTISGHKGRI